MLNKDKETFRIRRIEKIYKLGISIFMVMLLSFCIMQTSLAEKLTGVSLNATSLNLKFGDYYLLEARPVPSNASVTSIYWNGKKDNLINGVSYSLVTAIKDETCSVSVVDVEGNQFSASCNVKVSNIPEEGFVVFPQAYPSLKRGAIIKLYAFSKEESPAFRIINGTLRVDYKPEEFPVRLLVDNVDGSSNYDITVYSYDKDKNLRLDPIPELSGFLPLDIGSGTSYIPMQFAKVNQVSSSEWSVDLDIHSGVTWKAVTDSEWLSVSQNSGKGSTNVNITADPQTGLGVRTARLLVYGAGWLHTIDFSQGTPIQDIVVDETTFPDEHFRSYVIENFVKRYDKNGNGLLNDEEINAITSIDVSWKEIENLQGIGLFTKLETLYCPSNNLKSLDVSECKKLKLLNCYGNYNLSDLRLGQNEELEWLNS